MMVTCLVVFLNLRKTSMFIVTNFAHHIYADLAFKTLDEEVGFSKNAHIRVSAGPWLDTSGGSPAPPGSGLASGEPRQLNTSAVSLLAAEYAG